MKKEKITIFTFLNQIQTKQKKVPYDKKIASAWILSNFLSMDKSLIKYVNNINKYLGILPDEVIYNYYMSVIPKGKKYIKYIKKKKNEKREERIKKLKDLYPETSTNECKKVLNTLKHLKNKM